MKSLLKCGTVYISKKVDVYDLLDDGDLKKLMYLIEQQDVMKFDTKEFELKFLRDLESDLAQLKYLRDSWNLIDSDPKLAEFKRNLATNKVMSSKKILVFTESKETAEYLYDNLQDIYGQRVIYFSGQSSFALKQEIEHSFNPKFKDKEMDKLIAVCLHSLIKHLVMHRLIGNFRFPDIPENGEALVLPVTDVYRILKTSSLPRNALHKLPILPLIIDSGFPEFPECHTASFLLLRI